jgi:phage-related protein
VFALVPTCEVVHYRDADGSAPVLDWLAELGRRDRAALLKAHARLALLEEMGHELRRPVADAVRDGLFELRWRVGRSNYRILYFFHGSRVAVVAHGLTKEAALPLADIERALARKREFERDPAGHSFALEAPDG